MALLIGGSVLLSSASAQQSPDDHQVVRFYFPVGVAGPLARVVGEMTEKFNELHPTITVEAIYSGGYAETLQRAVTASMGGNPPDLAILTPADTWAGISLGILAPVTDLVAEEGGDEFLAPFYDAFVNDTYILGEHYGLPFQKSTPILYYNREHFEAAGLDPNQPPETWDELVEYAKQLTVREDGRVQRWGVQLPSHSWIYSALAMQAGGTYHNVEGTETYVNSPEFVEALQFMVDLVHTHGVMPASRDYGSAGADFVSGQTSMMYNSPGSLAFVDSGATFEWGVSGLPSHTERAAPTGGGSFVLFETGNDERRRAAWEYAKWMTEPEQVIEWTVASGYLPIRDDVLNDEEMVAYYERLPQARNALAELEYSQPRPPATFAAQEVFDAVTSAVEAALAGTDPQQALDEAQRTADRILEPYR